MSNASLYGSIFEKAQKLDLCQKVEIEKQEV